ncbi:iron-dependent repressor [Candidatus Marinamargulisbacteria bacterium SCGC AG-439-L15]|nr:iron-dependent repressor [Candidatus Marinamargulisbacteria bacterium SCGC AG-439-L15]
MEIAQENYLKLIYVQQSAASFVKPSYLAEALSVSNAAVTDMLKKLDKDGLVTYIPYQGVRLTKKGDVFGRQMVRRHRLWELYLHEVLGFSWEAVHDEAERLEHASSDCLIDKLDERLGFPDTDPHGDPIPSREGDDFFPQEQDKLSSLAINQQAVITRVSDKSSDFLKYLKDLSIQIKDVVVVKEKRPFDASMVIEVNGNRYELSRFSVDQIYVKKERSN